MAEEEFLRYPITGSVVSHLSDKNKCVAKVGHPRWWSREPRLPYLILSSASNSLRASHELTVLVALFLPFFSAHRS